MKLGVVCGFNAEIECFWRAVDRAGLDRARFMIAASGASSQRGREKANMLITQGCERLLSFGVGGGLTPRLRVGDVVFSNHVVTTLDESYGKRPVRRKVEELAMQAARTHQMSVCGVDEIVSQPKDKAKLHQLTRADLADMESHGVARVANENGLPFFILRAVSDAHEDVLPDYVVGALNEDGSPNVAPIIMALLKNPFRLPSLLTLKRNTGKALSALEKAATEKLPKLL